MGGELFDIKTGRRLLDSKSEAASSIIATGMLSQLMAEHGESPSEALSEALYGNINERLDALNPAQQEEAWQLAAGILD